MIAALPPQIHAGHSVQGRSIVAVRRGDPSAPVRVLAVGSIHGNETAGLPVVVRLRRKAPPAGVQVWTVRSLNPDGVARGTRQNARGVDLNRNFPRRWRGGGRAFDTYFPGPDGGSEPETRALMRLVMRIRPQLTVYYHQHMRLVNLGQGADPSVVRAYARRVGLPARTLPDYHGTATGWQNHALPGTSAFVVELPAGRLTPAEVRRHAAAVTAVARAHPAVGPGPGPPARAARAAAAKPPIVWSPIPFGVLRRREMRAYSKRHYGVASARLTDPKVIVEHVTVTSTYGSAWNTFASDAPDAELHERPGTCAHFIVDRDGTIHQLVRLKWRCRHTVGLNDTAIGIEHVGLADGDVMGRRRELRASLRLTRWLQQRFGIPTHDVIGHAESLSSPYHHELVERLRTQTHGDMSHATMQRYRRML